MSKLKEIWIELPPKWEGDNWLPDIPVCYTTNDGSLQDLWQAYTGLFWVIDIGWGRSNDYVCQVIFDGDWKQPIEKKTISGITETIKWIKQWFIKIEELRKDPTYCFI